MEQKNNGESMDGQVSPDSINSVGNVSTAGMFQKPVLGFSAKMLENLRDAQIAKEA